MLLILASAACALAQETVPLPPMDPLETIVAGPSSGESLEAAFQAALAVDQHVEAGRWNVSSAQSSLAGAQAERLPSVKFGADYYAISDQPAMQIDLTPVPIVAEQPILDRSSSGFHGVVSQPLYTSGRITAGIDAAHSGVRAQQADLCRTVLDVKMEVAESFVAVLRAARLVDVAEAKLASLNSHHYDVASFYERSIVSRNDFLSAEVALANAQQQAFEAKNQLELARAAYNRAVGRNLAEPVQLAELRDDGAQQGVDELTTLAMRQRPELTAMAAQARALEEQATSERAKNGPQVQLQGGYLYQQNSYIEPNGVAGMMVGVEWNALDMGRASNASRALVEKSQALVRMRRDAETKIALEVRQRWLELQTARQRVQVARQTTAQADENIRVARERYQAQIGTNTEVLDAETLRVQAYTNYFDSTYQAVLAGLRLRRAVGVL